MYNMKYGNPDCPDEEVYEITQKLGIYEKITSLEEGFESQAGTLGSKLSGGEKQRVLLARAILKNSSVIILDEPTSSLDSDNELKVMNLLNSIKEDKNIIICTHKLNTLEKCDNIYVIGDGEVVENGSHAQLISDSNSHYYDLYQNHFSKNENE